MNEKNICTELVRSINNTEGLFCYKIPDPGRRSTQQFIPARAFDILVCREGKFIAIEVKFQRGPNGISEARITEFEHRSLLAVEGAGGASYLLIAYYFYPTERQQERWNLPTKVKRIYYQRYHSFARLLEKGTVSFKTISRFPHIDYDRGWDLSFLKYASRSDVPWQPFQTRIREKNDH